MRETEAEIDLIEAELERRKAQVAVAKKKATKKLQSRSATPQKIVKRKRQPRGVTSTEAKDAMAMLMAKYPQ